MGEQHFYFKDNFFSAGRTEILNSSNETIGELDLKSAFSSGVNVLDKDGHLVVSGRFRPFSNKWEITDKNDHEIGILKKKVTLMSKKYEYNAYGRGLFTIESEPFSRKYEIFDEQSNLIARFDKVSGVFASAAYELSNFNGKLPSEELIAVVMGINAIRKRRNSHAAGNGGAGS